MTPERYWLPGGGPRAAAQLGAESELGKEWKRGSRAACLVVVLELLLSLVQRSRGLADLLYRRPRLVLA